MALCSDEEQSERDYKITYELNDTEANFIKTIDRNGVIMRTPPRSRSFTIITKTCMLSFYWLLLMLNVNLN